MLISEPGIYQMDAAVYHSDPTPTPSLSSGTCKILINESPQHAWIASRRLNPNFEEEEATRFDIGSAAHSLMLNDPRAFEICDYADWKKKEAQEKKAAARAAGKIPLLTDQWVRLQEMVEAGRMQLATHQDASNAFTDGKPEQSLFWRESNLWGRARLDWLRDARDVWDDYKSTESSNPDSWQRIAFSTGVDIQAAWYRRGIRALNLHRNPKMRFIVQEKSPPYALTSFEFLPEALELADRRIDAAISKWRWCLAHDSWPGYIGKTVSIAAPNWHETSQMERETREQDFASAHGYKDSAALLDLGLKFHSPL